MKDTKLIQLLRTFSRDEFKEFEKFTDSDLFLKRADVRKLYQILKAFFPDFEDPELTNVLIYKKLYPGKKFNGSVLRKITSELFKMAEEYLRLSLSRNMPIVQIELMNEFGKRKLDKLFKLKQKELNEYFNNLKEKDQYYYLYKAQLELSIINFNLSKGDQLSIVNNVNDQGKYLIYYFLIRILNIAQDMQVNRNLYNANFEFDHINNLISNLNIQKLIDNLKKIKDPDSIVPEVYYYIYLAYTDYKNDEHFFRGRDLFYKNINLFSKFAVYNIFLFLENNCTRRIINGHDEFIAIVFELYKKILKEKAYIIYEDEYMPTDIFRNIVITSLKLKEFNWTKIFIKKYSKLLDPDQSDNLYNYSMARLNLETGNFEESLEFISKLKPDYFLFKNDIKNMQLRIFYELGYYEEALSLIDSYKHFLLKNKKVSALNKTSNLNFIRFYTEIFKHKLNVKNNDLEYLSDKLSKTIIVGNRNWLKEKINEIKS